MTEQFSSQAVRIADYQTEDRLRLVTPNAYAMERAVEIPARYARVLPNKRLKLFRKLER
jgi:hypothetical protein